MILRVLQSQWAPFIHSLCARRDVETAGIILAERFHGGEVLFGRRMLLIPEEG